MRREFRNLVVVLVAAAVAFTLGCIGFARYGAANHIAYTPLDVMYLAWQLFSLESGSPAGPKSWQLEVARVLAPLVMASAVFGLFYTFLRDRWRQLRLATVRGHVIVCGLGRRGAQLAEECAALGRRVVAIDTDLHAAGAPLIEGGGALFVPGDATAPATLARAHIERAETLIALCGDDGTNIAIALRAREALGGRACSTDKGRLNCIVQVMDFTFAALFREHDVFRETGDCLDVSLFNSYEVAARVLLRDRPLDYSPIGADDPRRVHLIVFGLGQMGESVVVQAAKVCHVANGKRLAITVFDRAAGARQRSLLVRYPQLGQVCDITFVQTECDDSRTIERVTQICADAAALPSIAVCFDNDSGNAQYALSLRRHLMSDAVPILVRITADSGLSTLFNSAASNHNLFCFGSAGATCTWETVRGGGVDALARFIHEDYVAKQRERGAAPSESTAAWDRLAPGLRESNRQQADHLPVKLRALGYNVRTAADFPAGAVAVPPGAVETLARMEHARWNAERFLAGWTLGEKDVAKRRSPYLVAYDALPDAIQEYDRDTVRNIPLLVEATRRALVPRR